MEKLGWKRVLFLGLLIGLSTPVHAYAESRADFGSIKIARHAGHRSGFILFPTIAKADLPPEGRKTLRLIKQGGPFLYRKDGTVFQNRERRLPRKPRGYYREYTVPTPGSRGRGPRRIVAGSNGEFYYTDDHYRTFRLIKE